MAVREINCDFPACTTDKLKYNSEFSPSIDSGCSLKPPIAVCCEYPQSTRVIQ